MCSEFAVLGFAILCGNTLDHVGPLTLHLVEFLVHRFEFGGITPRLIPVDVCVGSWGGANHFEHPFRRIGLRRTSKCTISFEVAGQCFRGFTDGAEIDSLTPFLEEQQPIETLEENSRWLMDGAKNGLAIVLELLQKIQD